MDKTQTETSAGKSSIGNTEKADIQLADILKPSTLIIALIVLVLTVVLGWYIYVLKPALSENESMVHFMEFHQGNDQQANLDQVEVSTKNTMKNVGQTNSQSISKTKATENKAAKNKTAISQLHKTPQHTSKSTLATHKSSSAENPSKCTQAQIALHQCF